MPTDFENSSMKNSFSLSSLQSSNRKRLDRTEQATILPGRPYNSLTKKLRKISPDREKWRNSWSSCKEDNKDEFWAALQNNYQYLMDNNLIESCNEVKNDINVEMSPIHEWSLEQLKDKYVELDSWLDSIQDTIYPNDDSSMDRRIRLGHVESMQRKFYQRRNFINQSIRLANRLPKLKEEVSWRVTSLIAKWDRLSQILINKNRVNNDYMDVCIDVRRELQCLRKWIKCMENKLQPLDLRKRWTLIQLKQKSIEHQVLQEDVISHSKTVLSVVKLCEKLAQGKCEDNVIKKSDVLHDFNKIVIDEVEVQREGQGKGKGDTVIFKEEEQLLRWANYLQRRWHLLYLGCIEWQCFIENKFDTLNTSNLDQLFYETDDEQPVLKQRKLNNHKNNIIIPIASSSFIQQEILLDEKEIAMDISGINTEDTVDGRDNLMDSSDSSNIQLNANYRQCLNNFVSLPQQEIINKMMMTESSLFNRSDKSAPNCAIYYYKHMDTDSEQEKIDSNKLKQSKEESSEEEWTYTSGKMSGCSPIHKMDADLSEQEMEICSEVGEKSPETIMSDGEEKATIKKLVDEAEELLKDKSPRKSISFVGCANLRGKHNDRVKEWLWKCGNNEDAATVEECTIGDSCDASGEYTTEDDDILTYERRSSCEQTITTVVNNDNNNDFDASNDQSSSDQTSKVVMRAKSSSKKSSCRRPLSTSELSKCNRLNMACSFSLSESALHDLPSSNGNNNGNQVLNGDISSSTIEECTTQTLEGSGCSFGSLRRRKVKHKRRNTLSRKNRCSSAESLSSAARRQLKFSGSKSNTKSESLSDSLCPSAKDGNEYSDGASYGARGKIKRKLLCLPAFKLGPTCGAVTAREMNTPIHPSLEENNSSFSEQAWDSYQEKYMSEAYSEEAPDAEQVKRLLDFGDDYRKYIDSQSDCASNFSKECTLRGRYGKELRTPVDSDESDLEDVRSLIHQSQTQYFFSEQLYSKEMAKPMCTMMLTKSDFTDIKNRCRENVRCLRVLLDNVNKDNDLLSSSQIKDINDLVQKWELLEERADDLLKFRSLQQDMKKLKNDLQNVRHKMQTFAATVQDRTHLESHLQLLKMELANMKDRKEQMVKYNVVAHRLVVECTIPVLSIKDEVTQLYRIWEEINQRLQEQVKTLQDASATWKTFESELMELENALRGDHNTLYMLHHALQQGSCNNNDLTNSVRDLAKVLSEKQMQNKIEATGLQVGNIIASTGESSLFSIISGESSLSDSGISDSGSGSESDLSEREKRLATLRKLARNLEGILAPGSVALNNITKRIEKTENELKELQKTCRKLIVKTTMTVNAGKVKETISKENAVSDDASTERKSQSTSKSAEPESKGSSLLWRTIRAALPFHMAIVVLLCVACLLEPRCCDVMNNFSLSWSPQIRYSSGPRPI